MKKIVNRILILELYIIDLYVYIYAEFVADEFKSWGNRYNAPLLAILPIFVIAVFGIYIDKLIKLLVKNHNFALTFFNKFKMFSKVILCVFLFMFILGVILCGGLRENINEIILTIYQIMFDW